MVNGRTISQVVEEIQGGVRRILSGVKQVQRGEDNDGEDAKSTKSEGGAES